MELESAYYHIRQAKQFSHISRRIIAFQLFNLNIKFIRL